MSKSTSGTVDDVTFAAFAVEYRWVAERHATVILGNRPHDVEDVTQLALLAVYEQWDADEQDAERAALLATVATRRALDLRRRAASLPILPVAAPPEPVASSSSSDTIAARDLLRRLLPVLPPEDRALVYYRVVGDMSYNALASHFGVQARTLRQRCGRALARLHRAAVEGGHVGIAAVPAFFRRNGRRFWRAVTAPSAAMQAALWGVFVTAVAVTALPAVRRSSAEHRGAGTAQEAAPFVVRAVAAPHRTTTSRRPPAARRRPARRDAQNRTPLARPPRHLMRINTPPPPGVCVKDTPACTPRPPGDLIVRHPPVGPDVEVLPGYVAPCETVPSVDPVMTCQSGRVRV
jgi:RNA polymerase sigma-70 factor (ECF subfamily)